MQLRIRLPDDVASELAALSPRQRARVVAILLRAQLVGVAPKDLVAVHRNLQLLGHLLNQSLRASHGKHPNAAVVEGCVNLLKKLTK